MYITYNEAKYMTTKEEQKRYKEIQKIWPSNWSDEDWKIFDKYKKVSVSGTFKNGKMILK